ncbi:MAG: EAL domain-containing protein [Actinomycetota bacterium]|nr:EAL domain-containing protein [Actinomycetota bacterium]
MPRVLRSWLPQGKTLPDEVWAQRHQRILVLLWLHVPALVVFALFQERTLLHSLVEVLAVAVLAVASTALRTHRRVSTVVAALGLLTCSAILVHLSGGVIEMHFHYFVIVGVVTLYQDWLPFLVAIAYVVLQHGLAGALDPDSVYNHAAAIENPWRWAAIHGLFILGMSSAGIASWRLNEDLLRSTDDRQERLSEAQEVARMGSWEWSVHTGHVTWSDELYRLVGEQPGRFVPTSEALLSKVHPDDRDAVEADLRRTLEEGRAHARDFRLVLPDGTVRWVHGRGRVAAYRDGVPAVLSGTAQNITERKELENELVHQAFHDPLTNLANQALFRDRVQHALARVARQPDLRLAVLFLDLDNFKTVNDSLGHTTGDDLLTAVAERLRGCLRTTDTAARLGGDEFAVLVEDLEALNDAVDMANRVLSALQQPFTVARREVFVSASVGIAFDTPGTQSDQLLRNADLAMYTAKRRGKARYEIFQPEMHTAAMDRLEIEADLRRALDRGELTLRYQPIVVLGTGRISGLEALIRWDHPERGMLRPDLFVPLAEETGLIGELGRQVLVSACAQARRWQLEHPTDPPLRVSVNLSPRQLLDDALAEQIPGALGASGLPPSALVLEITESAMMHDTESAVRKLHALKDLGVWLAVDDFGTGYSSLSYLQRFPIDILKIDRSFVSGIESDDEKLSLVRAIVSLAQTLRLQTVAEGVETARQAEVVTRLGCDLAQGYHLAPPMDVEVLGEVLRRGFIATSPQAPSPSTSST